MTAWGMLGGALTNNSKRRVIIAYDHPTKKKTWAHSVLEPGMTAPTDLDVDGFRSFDGDIRLTFSNMLTNSKTAHYSWWKLRNGHIAVINDVPDGLDFSILTDDAFGLVTWAVMPKPQSDDDFGWKNGKEVLPL